MTPPSPTQTFSYMIFNYTNCMDRKRMREGDCPCNITDKTGRRKSAKDILNYLIHLHPKQKDASFHAMSQTLPYCLPHHKVAQHHLPQQLFITTVTTAGRSIPKKTMVGNEKDHRVHAPQTRSCLGMQTGFTA